MQSYLPHDASSPEAGGPVADPLSILRRYYDPQSPPFRLLAAHGLAVAEKALACARAVAHLAPDLAFVREAALLHDIGIFLTDTPSLGCHGDRPYVCHGVLGRELLEGIGLPRHGLVCERHVGAGLEPGEIRRRKLPLPVRDMRPVSIEEILVCYADKFFSKNGPHPERPRTVAQARQAVARYGEAQGRRFQGWVRLFGDGDAPAPSGDR